MLRIRTRSRVAVRPTLVLLAVGAMLSSLVLAAGPASAAVPPVPSGLPSAIESQSIQYVPQTGCDPFFQPGTTKLGHLLSTTYRGVAVGGMYNCGTDGSRSEHYEGRAIDWMTSLRNKTQAAYAGSFINWLLATDKAGHKFAMARRLGIMYLIWNNKIWEGGWQEYNNCGHLPQVSNDNACHRTHVHISLTWNGAEGRTTYWAKKVYATDYGPCRPRDLNWAARYYVYNSRACPRFPVVNPPARASATVQTLVHYSGAQASAGPALAVVQKVLHVSASGVYTPATRAIIISFQRRHHLSVTGYLNYPVWRKLLQFYAH
jgi:peptidoglycan hydrolase-like protein with peptidoglycan-binding domain